MRRSSIISKYFCWCLGYKFLLEQYLIRSIKSCLRGSTTTVKLHYSYAMHLGNRQNGFFIIMQSHYLLKILQIFTYYVRNIIIFKSCQCNLNDYNYTNMLMYNVKYNNYVGKSLSKKKFVPKIVQTSIFFVKETYTSQKTIFNFYYYVRGFLCQVPRHNRQSVKLFITRRKKCKISAYLPPSLILIHEKSKLFHENKKKVVYKP